MRIVLLYPPPWKINSQKGEEGQSGDLSPADNSNIEDMDEKTMPYGLMSLAAQARRNGHDVILLNLYTFAWKDIAELLRLIPADVFGMSCFTTNRIGALSLSNLIRDIHPESYIVLGGPHASALPIEIMQHCDAINGIVIGEGEASFNELIERLQYNKPTFDIPGMAHRTNNSVDLGPARDRIGDLDRLASPFDYYKGHLLITSRGCPGSCTFCGSRSMWGKRLRFHSAEYTVNMLHRIISKYNERLLAIKDDTFTCNRKRVIKICNEIIKHNLRFVWSCDTRVDTLDEEVLFAMRKAGCQIISLGVESASREILNNINKGITPEKILLATNMAKKFGFQVRYYMMAGNRGESAETLQESIDFISKAKPNKFLFSFLSIFPGTKEFELAEKNGIMNREVFFNKRNQVFKYFYGQNNNQQLNQTVNWIKNHMNSSNSWDYSVSQLERILKLFPELTGVHMDLGKALYQKGDFNHARKEIMIAMDSGYPLQDLVYNYLACISAKQGDIQQALHFLEEAKKAGTCYAVEKNLSSLRSWAQKGGMERVENIELIADHNFVKGRFQEQPLYPGPISLKSTMPNSHSALLVPAM